MPIQTPVPAPWTAGPHLPEASPDAVLAASAARAASSLADCRSALADFAALVRDLGLALEAPGPVISDTPGSRAAAAEFAGRLDAARRALDGAGRALRACLGGLPGAPEPRIPPAPRRSSGLHGELSAGTEAHP